MLHNSILLRYRLQKEVEEQPTSPIADVFGSTLQRRRVMDCYLCSTFFQAIDSLMKHLQIEHGTPAISNYKCTACKPAALFKDVHRFRRHVNACHHSLFQARSVPLEKSGTQHEKEKLLPSIEPAPMIPENEKEFENTIENEDIAIEVTSKEEKILEIRSKLREVFLSFTVNLYGKKKSKQKRCYRITKKYH